MKRSMAMATWKVPLFFLAVLVSRTAATISQKPFWEPLNASGSLEGLLLPLHTALEGALVTS